MALAARAAHQDSLPPARSSSPYFPLPLLLQVQSLCGLRGLCQVPGESQRALPGECQPGNQPRNLPPHPGEGIWHGGAVGTGSEARSPRVPPPSPWLSPELQGVDQNGDQEHRGGGQVLQRPHHQGVRPGHLARGALRPENPPTQQAQGGGRGRDPQRDGGAGVAGVPGGCCCCCCCWGSFIGKSKTVLPCCLR